MTSAAYVPGKPILTPRADGQLAAEQFVLLPIMAPRLQGDVEEAGKLTLALWGAGTLAGISFEPLTGPYVYGPNRVTGVSGGVHVAQSAPVMVIRGTRALRVSPSRRASWWHEVKPGAVKPKKSSLHGMKRVELPWGAFAVDQRGDDLVLSVGATLSEAMSALSLSVETIVAEAEAYVQRCDRLPDGDPLLRSLVSQGTHAALSSIRLDPDGGFAGLAAGQAYSTPARTYFRDGYWTLQPLLELAPEAVRDQIRVLAGGIRDDGQAPSGVILSGPAQSEAWEAFRQTTHPYNREHLRPNEWWSDHFDSPLFFVLTLGDYVAATGDIAEAKLHWSQVLAVIERYVGFSGPDSLPRKPNNERDWADNVYREGVVSYDIGLWVGALDAVARLGAEIDKTAASRAKDLAKKARASIDATLWVAGKSTFADYANTDGFVEDHVMIDTMTLLRFDAISEAKAKIALETVARVLETRNNSDQPYGDWGVMCAFPSYRRAKDVRAKSAFPFRYHNGADWPYLDAIYAQERLRRNLGGARYALTRWWEICLMSGWAGPTEYFSPPFGRGSLLQGWSGLPTDVILRHKAAFDADKAQ